MARGDQAPSACGQDQDPHRLQRRDRLGDPCASRPAEVRRYRDLLLRAVPLAVELRHKPTLAARDGDELVCTCRRCSALGYGNAAEDIVGGVVFEDECRNVEPPRLTMAMMHVPGSRWASDGPGRA